MKYKSCFYYFSEPKQYSGNKIKLFNIDTHTCVTFTAAWKWCEDWAEIVTLFISCFYRVFFTDI